MEPKGLSRRIEELAAMAGDEPEVSAEELDEGASLGIVRGEIAALRADLIGMRGEMGSVRTDIDGLSGRLTGSVAAGRTETGALARRVAELVNRVEVVGTRVEDLKTDLPLLVREVRDGLELVPVRTGAKLDELTGKLSDSVGTRVEAVAADVRRTLAAGLEREADSAAATQGLMSDTRASLESRMAVLEDTIDSLAERLEGLTRDGVNTTADHLRQMAEGVTAIEQRVEATAGEQVERIVARLRDVTESRLDNLSNALSDATRARNEQLRRELTDVMNRASTEQEATRNQVVMLTDVIKAATEAQASTTANLEERLTTSLSELREEVSTELDDVAERLLVTVTDLREDQRAREELAVARMSALQVSIEAGTEAIRAQVLASMETARAEMASEVATLGPRIEEVLAAAASAAVTEQEARAELHGALDNVRERVAVAVSASTESVRAALEDFTTRAIDSGRIAHEALLDRLSDQHAAVTGRLADVGAASSGTTAAGRETAERLAALTIALDEIRRSVEALQGDWPKKSDQAAAAARSAAEGVLAEMRTEVRKQLDAVIGEVARATGGIEDAKGRLATAVDQVAEQAALQRQETVAVLKLAGTRAPAPLAPIPPVAKAVPAPVLPTPVEPPAATPEPAEPAEPETAEAPTAPAPAPQPVKQAAKKTAKRTAKKAAKKSVQKTAKAVAPKPATPAAAPAPASTTAPAATEPPTKAAPKKAPAKKAPVKKAAATKAAAKKAPAKQAVTTVQAPTPAPARPTSGRASIQGMPQVPSPGAAVDAASGPARTTAPQPPAGVRPATRPPQPPSGTQPVSRPPAPAPRPPAPAPRPAAPSSGGTAPAAPRPEGDRSFAPRPDARPAAPPAKPAVRRLFGRRKP